VDDKEQNDIKFYRQLVKDAATENERLQNACKSYVAQANKDALELDRLRRELAEAQRDAAGWREIVEKIAAYGDEMNCVEFAKAVVREAERIDAAMPAP